MASSVAAPTEVAVGRPKAKWTRVAALGFTLIAAAMVLWIVGGVIAGQELGGEEVAFMGGGGVVALIAAAVSWRFGTAGKSVAIVLGLAIMAMLFWVAFSLGVPSAFVEFSGAVMFVLGAFTGVGYSIASIVRRRDLHSEATRGETLAMRIMLGVVAAALVVSGALNLTMRTSVESAAAAGATPATMSNFAFEPATFEATAGQPTQFLVHNGDAFTHDFVIESLGVNSGLVTPGSEKLVEVDAPAGEYVIRCTLHSGDGDTIEEGEMKALLVVE